MAVQFSKAWATTKSLFCFRWLHSWAKSIPVCFPLLGSQNSQKLVEALEVVPIPVREVEGGTVWGQWHLVGHVAGLGIGWTLIS